MIELDAKAKRELLKQLIRQSGWKIIEELLESQWTSALSDFKNAVTINEFCKAQAIINQIEFLLEQENSVKLGNMPKRQLDFLKKIMVQNNA